jgi:transcriptional regulator with XRE-family HTH domain
MNLSQQVGANLKQARKECHLTQSQVAAALGQKAYQQYADYEYGRYQLSYEQIVALCQLLDITPNYLFGFDEYK